MENTEKIGKPERKKKRNGAWKAQALRREWRWYGLLFLAGLALVLYPVLGGAWNRLRAARAIEAYEQEMAASDKAQLAALVYEAREYNRLIATAGAFGSFAAQADAAEREEELPDFTEDGIMGWLEIPAIGVSVPVGRERAGGALVQLAGSSLPAGEADANCVIADEGGLPGIDLLSKLDRLQEEDILYLHVAGQIFAYRVDEIRVVDKEDSDSAAVRPGSDRVTLIGREGGFGGVFGGGRLSVSARRTTYSPGLYETRDAR